jgi:uncharacterized protein YigE (DUF2233 family)
LVFDIDLARLDLHLLGQLPGEPRKLKELPQYVRSQRLRWAVATNAGIFDPQLKPVGLHIQGGQQLHALSTAQGQGNFFLKPNGVFWVDEHGAHVAETSRFVPGATVALATQSGPLLLEAGSIHPAFSATGTSLKVRSAVGVDTRGHVQLALSQAPVNFHATASLFRDVLDCPNALYLDGYISAIAAPGMQPVREHEYAGLLVATWR